MWFLSSALAGMPQICAPPLLLPFLEEHAEPGSYLRPGHNALEVEQAVEAGETLLLWVRCEGLMADQSQLVAWKTGEAPMEAIVLGFRGIGVDRWWQGPRLSTVEVGWPDRTAVQVEGPFTGTVDDTMIRSDAMRVWVVGYPALDEHRRFGQIEDGPRHGHGCPERGVPNGRQTEVWMPASGRVTATGWHADATVATTHRWEGGVLHVEERWTPTKPSDHPTVVQRTSTWKYGGLHETCRTE